MIKIIRGVYGARQNGRVVPVTNKSEPIQLTEKEEARLVKAGFAEYVNASQEQATATPEPAAAPEQPETKPLEKMNFEELKALAAEKGLDVKSNKKADYIAALQEAEDDAEDQEPAPAAPTFDGDTVID
jgi:hypothetical protein